MTEIAVFSTSIDEPTYAPVVEKLHFRGYETWVYNADKVLIGTDSMDINVDSFRGLNVTYNDTQYYLSDIQSAWFRHPNIFNLNLEDKAKQLCLEDEIVTLQESIWQGIPDESWLNHPNRMKAAQAKLAQLAFANMLGFRTPRTLVTNNWEEVDEYFGEGDIIVKMSRGLIYDDNEASVLYTTMLDANTRKKMKGLRAFPAIYQDYEQKLREWRITIVEDNAFQASIYTAEDAKDDWRKYQFTNKVQFKSETMPAEELDKCFSYLSKIGLKYGAFDFIESDDGTVTFLECNTNGQYMWLEELLGFPISDAIATALIKQLG